VQRSLFDVQNLIGRDFDPTDRFRLFQEKIYPTLLAAREERRRGRTAKGERRRGTLRLCLDPPAELAKTFVSYGT